MRIESAELIRVVLRLVTPFRTSFGSSAERETSLLHLVTDVGEGWSESAAEPHPLYSSEFLDAGDLVVGDHLLPRLLAAGDGLAAADVAGLLAPVKGHFMSKALLETALLDAETRGAGVSFGERLGAVVDRVPCGVSVGIMDELDQLLDAVAGYLDAGYRRIKLKIEPGWDVEPVRLERERFGLDILLQVDANTAYTLADAEHLAELDAFDLVLIEQPLPEDDLLGHADLAALIRTPVCLDESITSARDAVAAIRLGAAAIINIKPARVGGYLEAVRIHDVCVAAGIPVWCGGMLETGIGRGANLALAALPGFTLPGDTSASSRYYAQDLTAPFVLDSDGYLDVPTAPGTGVVVLRDVVDSVTTGVTRLI